MLKNLGFVLLQLAQNSCVVAVFSEPVSDWFVHLRELRNLIFWKWFKIQQRFIRVVFIQSLFVVVKNLDFDDIVFACEIGRRLLFYFLDLFYVF